jgi:hypothetical protein
MISRRNFALTGLATAGLAAWQGSHAAAAPGDQPRGGDQPNSSHFAHDDAMAACARACSDCQRACDMCSTHCANQLLAGHKEHVTTLASCRDCADFCSTAAEIVARGGPFATLICGSCAEACAQCGAACEKFPDDAHMKACAVECRKCEKACRDMVAHAGHAHKE